MSQTKLMILSLILSLSWTGRVNGDLIFKPLDPADYAADPPFENTTINAPQFYGVGLMTSLQPQYFNLDDGYFSCNLCQDNDTAIVIQWTEINVSTTNWLYISMALAAAGNKTYQPLDSLELTATFDNGSPEVIFASTVSEGQIMIGTSPLTPIARQHGSVIGTPIEAQELSLKLTLLTTRTTEDLAAGSLRVESCLSSQSKLFKSARIIKSRN